MEKGCNWSEYEYLEATEPRVRLNRYIHVGSREGRTYDQRSPDEKKNQAKSEDKIFLASIR